MCKFECRFPTFNTPYGAKRIVYADWTASGRLYRLIEGNTHTETTVTGTSMTKAYHTAHRLIKEHVNAGPKDVIITTGSGMTRAVTKFQRILGLKVPE